MRPAVSSLCVPFAALALVAACGGAPRHASSTAPSETAPSSRGDLRDRPTPPDVVEAMRPALDRFSGCGGHLHGEARVEMLFSSDGRVSDVRFAQWDVTPDDPAARSCIEGALFDVRLEPFARPQFRVVYPIRFGG